MADAKEKFAAMAIEPAGTTPEETGNLMRQDYERWGPVLKAANIKPE